MRLKGRIAVVTGATSGFGTAIARVFAEEGASLVLHGRNAERGAELLDELAVALVAGTAPRFRGWPTDWFRYGLQQR